MTKSKQLISRSQASTINIVICVLTLLANALIGWSILSLTRYSNFSKIIFLIVSIVVLLLLLFLNFMVLAFIKTRRKNLLMVLSGMLVVYVGFGLYTTYVISRVNINVDKIVSTGEVKENIETSFVVYDEKKNFSINKVEELNGKTVGVVVGSNNGDLGKEEIASKNIMPSFKEYVDYTEMLMDLFNDKIDCAILPSNYIGMFEVNEGIVDTLQNTKAIHTFEKVVKVQVESGSSKDVTKEPFTVLILGVDEGRSDAIMLASFNPISMNVTLTSLARDSYVPIACYAGQGADKLGHARVRSRQCTIDTVSKLMGVDIDYYFESNFKGVVAMVDALGGIIINNPIEFVGQDSSSQRGHYTVFVPKGENVPMSGEVALAFARERHKYAAGDFQRQANQQQVIQAILREIMRLRDVNKGLAMLDAAGKNVSTNFTVDQLISLFNLSMQKANRFYDKAHVEKVFNIIGSRVTGYDSGLWNEGLQMSLYIYRLYDGSLKDNRAMIERNINLKTLFNSPKPMAWDAHWEFRAPIISNEAYSEVKVAPVVPDKIANYVGRPIGKLTSWAKTFNIPVGIHYVAPGAPGYDSSLAEGTIVGQDVAVGTPAAQIGGITASVITHKGQSTEQFCPSGAKGTYPACDCSGNTNGLTNYDKNSNACVAPATAAPSKVTVIIRYNIDGSITSETFEAAVGSEIVVKTVAGYTANTSKITVAASNMDVTVVYTKKEVAPPPTTSSEPPAATTPPPPAATTPPPPAATTPPPPAATTPPPPAATTPPPPAATATTSTEPTATTESSGT